MLKAIGDWPESCLDNIHEFNGHGVDDLPEHSSGEAILKRELDSLYVQNGIEGAVDVVSGATLDPGLVRTGYKFEMGCFKTMGVWFCHLRSAYPNRRE